MEQKIDILFIHQGRISGNEYSTVIMPVALPFLASMLNKRGFKARVINLSAQLIFEPEYDVMKLINTLSPSFIGIPLQWHEQTKSALTLAARIKKHFPAIKIITGGFTASYFYREVMRGFPQVDFVIRGDAELPLLKLIEKGPDGNFSKIPNLSFRDRMGRVIHNPHTFTAKACDLDELDFADLSAVIHPENAFCYPDDFHFDLSRDDFSKMRKKFFYSLGRGCAFNCSFCAGSANNQLKTMGRPGPVYRSVELVAKDIESLVKNGWSRVYFPMDVMPDSDYYIKLFSLLRGRKISFAISFDAYGLPSERFLKSFAATFKNTLDISRITVSPETASENLRHKTRSLFYSNTQLLNFAEQAATLGITVKFFFVAGLPLEKKEDMAKTLELVKQLKNISNKFEFYIDQVALEPGAPVFMKPHKYRVKIPGKSLYNFLRGEKYCRYIPVNLSEKYISAQIKKFNQIAGNT